MFNLVYEIANSEEKTYLQKEIEKISSIKIGYKRIKMPKLYKFKNTKPGEIVNKDYKPQLSGLKIVERSKMVCILAIPTLKEPFSRFLEQQILPQFG